MLGALTPRVGRATWGRWGRGLSLVELMVVIAVAVVIIGLAAPSFIEYIVTQRVRSIHAQLITDLQYARSEAISRGQHVAVRFQFSTGPNGASCYIIYTRPDPGANPRECDCFAAPGSRCAFADTSEVRTVSVPSSLKVLLRVADAQHDILNFSPQTGSYVIGTIPGASSAMLASLETRGFVVNTRADDERALRVIISSIGRPQLCTPAGSRLGGTRCPP
jgi:type II secretory pathway pseudopilin PulG